MGLYAIVSPVYPEPSRGLGPVLVSGLPNYFTSSPKLSSQGDPEVYEHPFPPGRSR